MKKVGIMQPYFFPYVGYFSLIKHTDEFVLFDTVQFIRHGWLERNRVLKQNEGWLYIKAPLVKHGRESLIKDVYLDNATDWTSKIIAQLQTYKKIAPYYSEVMELLGEVFQEECKSLVDFNLRSIQHINDYLGITTPVSVFSDMNLEIEPANAPDEWALNICKAMDGVDEYWNPPGGQEFFDRAKYETTGLTLKFQKVILLEYDQKRAPFEPRLSIIDVMMFNSVSDIHEQLDNYRLT